MRGGREGRGLARRLELEPRTIPKNCFFWSSLYKIDVTMIKIFSSSVTKVWSHDAHDDVMMNCFCGMVV